MRIKKVDLKSFLILLLEVLAFYAVFLRKEIINLGTLTESLTELFIIINTYFFISKTWSKNNKVYRNNKMLLILIIINLIISFFIGGKQLFLTNKIVDLSILNFIYYILLNIIVFPIIYNFLYLMNIINVKERSKEKIENKKVFKFGLMIFLISFIIWGFCALSFYPGNMTSDTIDQLSQALGIYPIVDNHPAFYTILIRFILKIWNSPMTVIMSNILGMSVLLSYIFSYLYKNGFNKKILIILFIIFVFSGNNLMLLTILWKDIPFTIALLWLTFEVYKMAKEKVKYFNWTSIIKLVIALLLVYLLRVNGRFPYLSVIIYMLYLFFKENKCKIIIITICISIFSIWFVKNPIYKLYHIEKQEISGGASSFIIKGMGAVIYYDGKISPKDYKLITKDSSAQKIKKYYSPYNIDTYSFGEGKLRFPDVSSSRLYGLYLKNLFINPKIIIRDRLDSNNLLWSYITPDDGFNSTYVIGIWYPSNYNPKDIGLKATSDGVYKPKDNFCTDLILGLNRILERKIFYIIFWRAAFPLTLLLLLIYWLLNQKRNLFPMMFPTLINIAFWIVFMSHQSYRYVWFIFVNTFIMYLLALLETNNKKIRVKRRKK